MITNRHITKDYLLTHLNEALEHHYMKAYYHPVERTLTSRVTAFLVTYAWHDPDYGIIEPSQFTSVLEEYDMMRFVDLYILNELCRYIQKRACKANDVNIRFIMKLSSASLHSPDFITLMCQTLYEHQVSPFMIRFLFDEQEILLGGEIKEEIKSLMRLGFTIGLTHISLDGLKAKLLDHPQIVGVTLNQDMLDLSLKPVLIQAQSLIMINHEAHCHTLAMGINTKEQYDYFKAAGVERMCGDYLMKRDAYEGCIHDLEQKGLRFEDVRQTKYYNDAEDKVNFLGSECVAVIEYDGLTLKILSANNHFLKLIKSNGVDSVAALESRNGISSIISMR